MTTTALTIITGVLQELGVAELGQSIDSSASSLCLLALNVLADAWLTEPNYAYSATKVSAALAANTPYLTIGASQSLNCARPVRLEEGCYITSGGVDYPLEPMTEAQYNAVELKSLNGPWPASYWYDRASPTGKVYFWPEGACTVNLVVQVQVSQFAALTTAYTLPPGYERALKFTLMEEVAGSFSRTVTPLQMRNAKQARRVIKRANLVVPQLRVGPSPAIGIPPIY